MTTASRLTASWVGIVTDTFARIQPSVDTRIQLCTWTQREASHQSDSLRTMLPGSGCTATVQTTVPINDRKQTEKKWYNRKYRTSWNTNQSDWRRFLCLRVLKKYWSFYLHWKVEVLPVRLSQLHRDQKNPVKFIFEKFEIRLQWLIFLYRIYSLSSGHSMLQGWLRAKTTCRTSNNEGECQWMRPILLLLKNSVIKARTHQFGRFQLRSKRRCADWCLEP